MNKMLFSNYLKKYLRYVSNKKTLSVNKLFKASKNNIRIRDPLILYCVYNNKIKELSKNTKEYTYLYKQIKQCNEDFEQFKDFDFNKIFQSYLNEINKINYDNQIKLKIRDNIMGLKKEKSVSNYKIYKDLKLNPGNVNAFIKNKDTSKLSLNTAKRIVNYLYSY